VGYHNVSKKYLHRYIWQFDFIWNNRKLNDGERTAELIRVTEGAAAAFCGRCTSLRLSTPSSSSWFLGRRARSPWLNGGLRLAQASKPRTDRFWCVSRPARVARR
jgi:hypothetical protein